MISQEAALQKLKPKIEADLLDLETFIDSVLLSAIQNGSGSVLISDAHIRKYCSYSAIDIKVIIKQKYSQAGWEVSYFNSMLQFAVPSITLDLVPGSTPVLSPPTPTHLGDRNLDLEEK